MNRAAFEAAALHEGYEIRDAEIKPDTHREPHTHDWDTRLFLLDGHLTLVRGDGSETFGPGDICDVAANTTHAEHTWADGARFLAARRSRGHVAAA